MQMSGKTEKSTGDYQSTQPSFKRVLVAVDGSENSMRAAKLAVDMAKKYGAELIVLHVIPTIHYALSVTAPSATLPPGVYEEYQAYERATGESLVRSTVDLAKAAGVPVRSDVQEPHGSIVEGITDYALGEHVDLIVIGTRGLSGFKKLVIGSVSSGVVSHAYCSVLVVR
jgi:nucleotide-binding universal stress UspA family protein